MTSQNITQEALKQLFDTIDNVHKHRSGKHWDSINQVNIFSDGSLSVESNRGIDYIPVEDLNKTNEQLEAERIAREEEIARKENERRMALRKHEREERYTQYLKLREEFDSNEMSVDE